MKPGTVSISLAVEDIEASKAFHGARVSRFLAVLRDMRCRQVMRHRPVKL